MSAQDAPRVKRLKPSADGGQSICHRAKAAYRKPGFTEVIQLTTRALTPKSLDGFSELCKTF